MRIVFTLSLFLVVSGACFPQIHKSREPFPDYAVIARDSFFDFGPPFHYYDLTFLRSEGGKTAVERISLTPPADACYPRAEIEIAHATLNESLSSILHGTNPCEISEKALRAELKRKNKGLVFSGMIVSIQVQCAGDTRVIRADVLDRDIFGDQSKTPQYTSWSRSLFEKLDQATGQSPWEKPVFSVAETNLSVSTEPKSIALQAIADGKFDAIFGKDSDRPSELYRLAQNGPRQPVIQLMSSDPARPITYVAPVYPPIAKAARVHGTVEFHSTVGSDGTAQNVIIDSGPRMLWQAASEAITKWMFSAADSGKIVRGSIRFGLNCASDSR